MNWAKKENPINFGMLVTNAELQGKSTCSRLLHADRPVTNSLHHMTNRRTGYNFAEGCSVQDQHPKFLDQPSSPEFQ